MEELNDVDLYNKIRQFTWYIEADCLTSSGEKVSHSGTGICVRRDLIVTCAHVFGDSVRFADIRALVLSKNHAHIIPTDYVYATLLKKVPEFDLALLKLNRLDDADVAESGVNDEAVAEFGDGNLYVGQKVIAVGNPETKYLASYATGEVAFSCSNMVSIPKNDGSKCCDFDVKSYRNLPYCIAGHGWKNGSGTNGANEDLHPLTPIIVTNRLMLKRGFSGGPLCDAQGKVVGMNFRSSGSLSEAIHVSLITDFLKTEFAKMDIGLVSGGGATGASGSGFH